MDINSLKKTFADAPDVIKKRSIDNLDNSFYPTKQVVPYINIVHDRVAIEIMRGCPNLCRFCQAKSLYHHERERPLKEVVRLARESIDQTGYEEVSLLSLSSGNHSQIMDIITELIKLFAEKGISVSLPSLRVDRMLKEFPAILGRIKKSGLTFAPEAGSGRLRSVIKKEIDIDQLAPSVEAAHRSGWKRIKLYFMIGLPSETFGDIDDIIRTIQGVLDMQKSVNINVSVTQFIPKPHTPFQWNIMESEESVKEKAMYIKKRVKSGRVKLRFHDTKLSILEGILSRGDRRLGRAVLGAFKKGCRFDGWTEHQNFDAWNDAAHSEHL